MFVTFSRAVRHRFLTCVVATSIVAVPQAAFAVSSSFVSGSVLAPNGTPAVDATITLRGQNLSLSARSDARGNFSFPALPSGEYQLDAASAGQTKRQTVAAGADGTVVTLRLGEIREIGSVNVSAVNYAKRSGSDVSFTRQQLERLPSGRNLPSILTQLPAAARGSNGQIHINGDHNGLGYYVDGVQLPTSLSRALGNEIDVSTIGFLDVIEGAYPAQYGDRFAAVVDIGTKTSPGPAGVDASTEIGSYGASDTNLAYHTPLAKGGALTVATRTAQTNRGIDPAVPDFVHNRASTGSQFVRLTLPAHGLDTYNFDLIHSHQTFQIPPDTANGVPAITDNNELQDDTFASMQYRHAIGTHGSLAFGPSLKISHILDTNDPSNDLAPGAVPPPAGQTNCTDFSDCQYFSARGDRLAKDLRFNADYDLRSDRHEIKAGGVYGTTAVTKSYAISLQPYSALNPSGIYTVNDDAPNSVHQQKFYIQDTWKLGDRYVADYGLRADAFQIASNDFRQGFSQISPRLKFTRLFGRRASAYAYYGRLFTPFSFENISPTTAAALYNTQNAPGTSFDLRPQRDSLYELGGHVGLGKGELGLRLSHKVATDYLDDTQVGATNIHQDINFPRGIVDIASLAYAQPLARGGRAYLNVTRGSARNSQNCSTQLLQNCAAAGPPGGPFVQSDHDQRWSVSGGVLLNDLHEGWLAVNGEYGSGLSLGDTSVCPNGNTVNCKTEPHLIFSAEKGVRVAEHTTLSFGMQNLLNDRYAITRDSALQGTHYATGRTLQLVLRYSGK